MTSSRAIAVLGLGRMGAAMAARLQSLGWEVTGWTRSGRTVDSVKTACDPGDAVLGSRQAVASGTLQILAGADEEALARVRPVLDALGTVRPAADAATAAVLKLVANSSLAGAVLAPLRAYIRGHATGDPAHFRAAFLPTAHIEGLRGGAFVSWRLDDYCALFDGQPAPGEPGRSRRVDAVDVHGSVATASMTLWHGTDTFTDVFLLVRVDGEWRIANKAYHRH